MNSLHTIPCPACANPISIVHEQLNLVHCTKCLWVYKYANKQLAEGGSCTIIFQKTETIQPGTTGKWKDETFTVMGRCRLYLNESVFNYWTLLSSSHKLLWLAEGYGLYFIIDIAKGEEHPLLYKKLRAKKIGERIEMSGPGNYLVEQVQTCVKSEMEGQTFFPKIEHGFSVFELSNSKGVYLTAFGYDPKELYVYPTHPVTLEELSLSGLRPSAVSVKTFACTVCESNITVHNYPYAQSCICRSCGTGYGLDHTEFKRTSQKFEQVKIQDNPIRIGKIGKIKRQNFIVYGFVEKQEKNIYKSKWREYYLQGDNNNYAVLSEYDGHWIFIREASDTPVLLEPVVQAFEFNGKRYEKYNRYTYSLTSAAGEFPHNLLDNEETECFEYISPPFIWIYEKDKNDGIRWFFGEHIANSTVKDAFDLQATLPHPKGVGAVSPVPTDQLSKPKLLAAAFIGFALLLVLHFVINATKQNKVILPSQEFRFTDSTDIATFTGEKFELAKKTSNVSFHINAPVSNSWFELSASLTNTVTGEEFGIEQGVEYYSGYTDGEAWSEGGTSMEEHITGIPAGTYVLQMQGTREHSNITILPSFNVEIRYDVPEDTNFWWALAFILIWPGIVYTLFSYYKWQRWQNSPFSPYEEEDE